MSAPTIRSLSALQILDSRGAPTLEVEVILDDGTYGEVVEQTPEVVVVSSEPGVKTRRPESPLVRREPMRLA